MSSEEGGSRSDERSLNMTFDKDNAVGGGSFLQESSTLVSPVSKNEVSEEFSKYNDWNFAPSNESVANDDAHQMSAVEQNNEDGLDQLSLLQEQLSSEVGYDMSLSWLGGVPPEFIHEALLGGDNNFFHIEHCIEVTGPLARLESIIFGDLMTFDAFRPFTLLETIEHLLTFCYIFGNIFRI